MSFSEQTTAHRAVVCSENFYGAVDLVNERAVALFTSMLERSVAAVLDLDALELLPR